MVKKYLSGLISLVIGPSDRFPLESRIFNALIGTVLGICLIAVLQNCIVGLPGEAIIIALISLIFYSIIYTASRIGGHHRRFIWPAALGALLILAVMWVFNEGSAGGTHLFLSMAPLIFILFVSNRQRFIFLALYIAVTVALLTAEYLYPSFVRGRLSRPAHFIDLLSATVQVQLAIAITLVWSVKAFRNMLDRVEHLRRKSEERFSEVADQIPAIICEADLGQKFTYANRMAFQLTGYTAEDLDRGMHTRDVMHPGDIEEMKEGIGRLMAGQDTPIREYRIIAKDGTEKVVLTKATVIYTEGKITGIRSYMVDVTEKKKLEDHLRHSQKMESIGQLAGGIAHDFNNILTGILTSARLIEQEAASIDRKELEALITPIIAASTRASELVSNLLVFSRRKAYLSEPFDLKRTVDDAMTLLMHTIDKKIEIVKKPWSGSLVMRGDQSLVESAVINLVVNARDAMPDGGRLTIEIGRAAADGEFLRAHHDLTTGRDYAVVSVCDTGPGFNEEAKKHLFEPFFTTKEQGRGTGLGLASVYGVVKGHNGSIDVVSRKGEGTTVSLFFPLRDGTVKSHDRQRVSAAGVKGDGETILVIDDEEIILRTVEMALKKHGYAVTSFCDPVAAVEYYRIHASDISCVILDIIMPKMNGMVCYEKLRAMNASVKAIVTTGYANDPEFDAFVRRNKLPVIAKPFDIMTVLDVIKTILHPA
jgi:PAS domain S-box-containing protein